MIDSPVNSSSSDDFAAFLETELEATSAESSLDEEAEDDNYKMRKQGMKNLRMRKPEMKKPRMRRLQMIMASIARGIYIYMYIFVLFFLGCKRGMSGNVLIFWNFTVSEF